MRREKVLTGDTVQFLNTLQGCKAWRNNSGKFRVGDRWVQASEKGAADVLICYQGRIVAAEQKSDTGRQSPDQAKWQAELEAAGGLYVLHRTVEELLDAMGIDIRAHPRKLSKRRVIHRD